MEQQTPFFKVRDLRQKTQFKIDDAYLNGYARVCGINATLVYISLCRHAEFNTQKAFPSQEKIAWEHGISTRTIKRGLKELIKYNIILVEQEKMGGQFANNVYILLDKSGWKKLTEGQGRHTAYRGTATGGQPPHTVPVTHKDNKVLRITNIKDNKDERGQTPSQIMRNFILEKEEQIRISKFISEKYKADYNFVLREINKFISYWTEPTKSGHKQRWELEKTFELTRRLGTWFRNIRTFNTNNKKGVSL